MRKPLIRRFTLANDAETAALGRALAAAIPEQPGGCLVTLAGELGAGKTSLVRAFLAALGHQGVVPSPTYTLVEPYDLLPTPIYHVDLYRVNDEDEVSFLGWDDLRRGLVLAEWPERAAALTAGADVAVRLRYVDVGRSAELRGSTTRGAAWLAALDSEPGQ